MIDQLFFLHANSISVKINSADFQINDADVFIFFHLQLNKRLFDFELILPAFQKFQDALIRKHKINNLLTAKPRFRAFDTQFTDVNFSYQQKMLDIGIKIPSYAYRFNVFNLPKINTSENSAISGLTEMFGFQTESLRNDEPFAGSIYFDIKDRINQVDFLICNENESISFEFRSTLDTMEIEKSILLIAYDYCVELMNTRRYENVVNSFFVTASSVLESNYENLGIRFYNNLFYQFCCLKYRLPSHELIHRSVLNQKMISDFSEINLSIKAFIFNKYDSLIS